MMPIGVSRPSDKGRQLTPDEVTALSKPMPEGMTTEDLDRLAQQSNYAASIPGRIEGAVVDIFSAEDATVPKVTPGMYEYNAPEVRLDMLRRGAKARDITAGAGRLGVSRADTAAGTVEGAGGDTMRRAEGYGGRLTDLAGTASREMANVPPSYIDPYASGAMFETAGRASTFVPSAESRTALADLARYQAPTLGPEMGDTYLGLRGAAARPMGPSAAELQLQRGAERAIAGQMALAQSGRGAGSMAQAQRMAAANAAGIQSRAGMDAAQIRAEEDAAARDRQLRALGLAGDVAAEQERLRLTGGEQRLGALTSAGELATGVDQTRLQALGLTGDMYLDAANYGLDARTAADTMRQGWMDRGITAEQAGAGVGLAGAEARDRAAIEAARLREGGTDAYLRSLQLGLGAEAGYLGDFYGSYEDEQQRRADLYRAWLGGETEASIANQLADLEKDKQATGAVGTALALVSDPRAKRNIRIADIAHGGV